MAEECSSSSGMVLRVPLAAEGYLQWMKAQEEVGVHLVVEVGVEEASCPLEVEVVVVGELGPYLQMMAWVEEAGDHQVDPGEGEGLQEQQLPVSAGRLWRYNNNCRCDELVQPTANK